MSICIVFFHLFLFLLDFRVSVQCTRECSIINGQRHKPDKSWNQADLHLNIMAGGPLDQWPICKKAISRKSWSHSLSCQFVKEGHFVCLVHLKPFSHTYVCFPLSNGNHFQFTAFVLLLFIVISITLNMLLFGLSAFKIIYSFPSIADEDSGLFHFPSTQLTSSVISYYIWLDYYSILTLL